LEIEIENGVGSGFRVGGNAIVDDPKLVSR
jgi:hypothetical protein